MKRLIAIFFVSSILFAQTELHQLAKLPVLVQHFFEHKAENKDLSLVSFLKMHYFNGDPKDKDYERDMKLPFKSNDCPQVMSVYFSAPAQNEFDIVLPVVSYNNLRIAYTDWIPGSHVNDIFQPPKFS
ncbi:MAG: hypothetical protein JST26_14730 [Bacteroidetes bacterium]|nr:hypothetical protein [Bacteroidota bacterium]